MESAIVGIKSCDLNELALMAQWGSKHFLFVLTIALQALSMVGAVFFLLFYFAPGHLVLGTRISVAFFIITLIHPYLPLLSKATPYLDGYLRLLVLRQYIVLVASLVVAAGLASWSVVMFDELRTRYLYLEAINEAVSLVEADQVSMPKPELLAEAFQLKPDRPEVPFMLGRAVRLLAPDDNLGAFHAYMGRFVAKLNREAILAYKPAKTKTIRLGVNQQRSLPRLNPIELLVQFSIEAATDKQQEAVYTEAVEILDKATTIDRNPSLSLYRTSLDLTLRLDVRSPPVDEQRKVIDEGITSLDRQISEALAVRDEGRSPLLDISYQEALDDLGVLKMRRLGSIAASGNDPSGTAGCKATYHTDDAKDVGKVFSRLLSMRRRLMVNDEVLWWRPPQKLSLFYIFAQLAGLPNSEGEKYDKLMNRVCPEVWADLARIQTAVAFRTFQDPETWYIGTPLASSFNGAGAAAQLRKWLQLGW